jgi:hypothetical protein
MTASLSAVAGGATAAEAEECTSMHDTNISLQDLTYPDEQWTVKYANC